MVISNNSSDPVGAFIAFFENDLPEDFLDGIELPQWLQIYCEVDPKRKIAHIATEKLLHGDCLDWTFWWRLSAASINRPRFREIRERAAEKAVERASTNWELRRVLNVWTDTFPPVLQRLLGAPSTWKENHELLWVLSVDLDSYDQVITCQAGSSFALHLCRLRETIQCAHDVVLGRLADADSRDSLAALHGTYRPDSPIAATISKRMAQCKRS